MASPTKISKSVPTQKGPLTQELQTQVDRLLTEEDREFFLYALKEYSTYRSVGKLVMSLNSCLDTPEKKNMLPLIRNLLPKHDWKKFDALAPYAQMATPYTPSLSSRQSASTNQNRKSGSVRQVTVQRTAGSLGFSIRGGMEHGLGIFVSNIDEGSSADRSGLQVGDELLSANGVSLHGVSHPSAVRILKSLDTVKLEVLSRGQITGDAVNRQSFVWVDARNNSILEEKEEEEGVDVILQNGLGGGGKESHLMPYAGQKKKVILHTSQGGSLGLSIRGGKEYDLGVYVSSVERGSLAESCGLKVGDQILEVNGHDFQSILHAEAASILKAYPTLMLTVKGLGKLPKLPSELGPASQRRQTGPALAGRFQKNNESSRVGPPHHIEGQSPAEDRGRHASAPTTSPPHSNRKSVSIGEDPRRAFNHSKSPPTRSKSPPPQNRPPSTRSTSPPPRSRLPSRRSTSPPPQSRPPPSHNRPSPFRSKSPTRQEPRMQKEAGTKVAFQNHTVHTVEVDEAPQVARTVGNARRLPLVRSHSTKTPNLPITVISEEPEEEEEVGSITVPVLHHLKDSQRPHSFAGRGAKMRTPLPMRPSPLLVSETRRGVTTTPTTSPIYRTSSLPTENERAHRSNSLPLIGEGSPDEDSTMFSSGVGSQVMHVSVSSPAKEMLFDESRKYLDDKHLCTVKARLGEYERGTLSIEGLTHFFLSILDTPTKLQLLREIRSVLRASDLVTFDNLVSRRELQAIEVRSRTSSVAEDGKVPPKEPRAPLQPLVAELKGGVNLRKVSPSQRKKSSAPELGMFGHESAQMLVERAAAKVEDLPPRKRESYLAWKDAGGTEGAVEVEIKKAAPVLGVMIEGGKDTPHRKIRVHSVAEGSAADIDGFIQPGFEILEVDGKSLKARTQQDAICALTKCYASDRQTIKLTVLPSRKH